MRVKSLVQKSRASSEGSGAAAFFILGKNPKLLAPTHSQKLQLAKLSGRLTIIRGDLVCGLRVC